MNWLLFLSFDLNALLCLHKIRRLRVSECQLTAFAAMFKESSMAIQCSSSNMTCEAWHTGTLESSPAKIQTRSLFLSQNIHLETIWNRALKKQLL
ncbi:MAG: hypothetical protein A2161_03315 [Candidatus Schekmanbacteria bacterium RBG_13_48_7]|uniref:Uncharacterized protein n=1 Tax=Candidatus Schekmanbacteria bacterium RBG_13_48_7 TaxID=1817878 RepID=A0A1F7RVH2_9BACT|nr:MAG: hypothetical protein A2161_03315 [Candidatus Schekmanbacteria bacterium RBG_13_48_7]